MQQQRPPDGQCHAGAAVAATSPQHPPPSTPWLTPGSALLISSVPLGLGTYLGYRRSLHSSAPSSSASKLSGGVFGGKEGSLLGQMLHPEPPISATSSANAGQSLHPKPNVVVSATPPPVLAARALVLGSLLSVTGTALLVSGIFYASGCRSVDELMSTWRSWAPNKMQQLEASLGGVLGVKVGEERRVAKAEYERAVEGMTEEEEIEYARQRYGGEIRWDAEEDDGPEAKR
ncbi:hypothetical protein ACHAXT_001536 [Thalassiosira profunda]